MEKEISHSITGAQIATALGDLQKAISDTAISNGALVREDLQSGLAIAGPMETPLRNRLNRIQGNGNAHAYYMLKPNTDQTKGFFYGTTPGNAVFPKGGLPVDTTEQYDYVATPYFNLGDVAQVTFQDQAQGAHFTDLMTQRTKVKTKNAAMIEEYFIIWGDSSVIQAGGGFVFDGLIKQISNRGGQVLTSVNFGLGVLRNQIHAQWEEGGFADVAVMNGLAKAILVAQVNKLYGLTQFTGNEVFDEMHGGVTVNSWDLGYGPVEFIADRYMAADPYTGQYYCMTLDTKSQDSMNDGNVIQMVDVDAMHAVDLAIVGTAWRKVIYETCALMISVPQFQGIINGLTFNGQTPANPGAY